jgi:hypothetical protein
MLCKKMRKNKKIILISLIFVFMMIISISSVLASTYNQGIYKIGTYYKGDCNCYNKDTYCYHNQYNNYYDYEQTNKYSKSTSDSVNTIRYSQYSYQESRKSFLGDYVKEYSVYVTNRGRTGRYFTVVFEFEDKYGYEFTQSVTQYLKTSEKKKFVYRDIQYEKNEILDWDYEIVPLRY